MSVTVYQTDDILTPIQIEWTITVFCSFTTTTWESLNFVEQRHGKNHQLVTRSPAFQRLCSNISNLCRTQVQPESARVQSLNTALRRTTSPQSKLFVVCIGGLCKCTLNDTSVLLQRGHLLVISHKVATPLVIAPVGDACHIITLSSAELRSA